MIKHGLSHHPIYKLWKTIKGRCYDAKNISYKYYGLRGIKICNEWINSPEAFVKWASENGYQKGLQIDRINNEGDYAPDNCRFVVNGENQKNKRAYSKTGIKYVYCYKNKYQVNKWTNGKTKHFGTFSNLEEAKKVAQNL